MLTRGRVAACAGFALFVQADRAVAANAFDGSDVAAIREARLTALVARQAATEPAGERSVGSVGISGIQRDTRQQ